MLVITDDLAETQTLIAYVDNFYTPVTVPI